MASRTQQDTARLRRAEYWADKLSRIWVSKSANFIRKEFQDSTDHIPAVPPERPRNPEQLRLIGIVYQDLLKDIHNNSSQVWVIGTIFLTGSLVILGLTITSNIFPFLTVGPMLISLSLSWSWFWLTILLSDINHRKFFLRSVIEVRLNLPRYQPPSPRFRGRYRFVLVPISLHLSWLAYILWLLPTYDLVSLLAKYIVAILLAVSLVYSLLRIWANYVEGVVLFHEEKEWREKEEPVFR